MTELIPEGDPVFFLREVIQRLDLEAFHNAYRCERVFHKDGTTWNPSTRFLIRPWRPTLTGPPILLWIDISFRLTVSDQSR